jgi:hypothetical protein
MGEIGGRSAKLSGGRPGNVASQPLLNFPEHLLLYKVCGDIGLRCIGR